ncbi:hypothetical protein HanRHA438_Chr09g0417791 [Helianthus annuus]|uniref:Uncharacterized protein n=1 Tax=Helianthus annuus TaxID=4232 RepID=A0A251TZH1_HELAN|nr:hypothetical protein HanXRQr2_Chr09g0405801 [Helianthus annuus]KAJ0527365.1 hypothetical protein HanHA300_Chr09g0333221 [Helianthus annuus]KAJ0536052.1 hypothetical protein HanIR_Chr09g0437311 [Helianthus annuus]KAJ0543767.1 hypothetical protein HanHA89_Chr09g0354201 [Helianthus annuus]KAJ0708820.1 hypothetical protein HanLR1_Chr09g0333501 [Helianthus annuus]
MKEKRNHHHCTVFGDSISRNWKQETLESSSSAVKDWKKDTQSVNIEEAVVVATGKYIAVLSAKSMGCFFVMLSGGTLFDTTSSNITDGSWSLRTGRWIGRNG